MLQPRIVGNRHYQVAREVRKTLATYEELKDIIAMLGLEELSREDRKTVFVPGGWNGFLLSPSLPPPSLRDLKAGWWILRIP